MNAAEKNLDTKNRLLTAYLNRCEQINAAFDKELDLAMRNASNVNALRADIERLTADKTLRKQYAREDMESAIESANVRLLIALAKNGNAE